MRHEKENMRNRTIEKWSLLLPAALLCLSSQALATPFVINVNFTGGLTASQQSVFTTAANTWMSLLPNYQTGIAISPLTINASGANIDGAGGILGSAGPNSIVSRAGFWLAATGSMQFDTADLTNLESNGSLNAVIMHEMAHVMGFGTLWTNNNVYVNGTGQFTGSNALSAYRTEFNLPAAAFVPVELGGGSGTANGHWDEVDGGGAATGRVSALGDMQYELMTGWLNSSIFISKTTVQSFVDIGFASAADVPEPTTLASAAAGALLLLCFKRLS